jgi:serine/threonine protein kinase
MAAAGSRPVFEVRDKSLNKSVFQQSALASGLLTQEELDEAIELIRSSDRKHDRPINDERLSKKLVALGRLNRWQAEQLREGRTTFNLGPYHIIDSIGQGGMGQVFKAEHSIMNRVVAVKVLPKHKSTPEAIAGFAREIRTQAQLDHENLVRAYDAGHDRNVHFLVTEFVPGTDLRRLIRRQGRLSMAAAANIITQASKGLAYAHNRGLIHRDVKPGNLLVTPDGHTKVSDLGLAGFFNEAEQTDIRGGKVVGTADYLAPEQITDPDRPTPVSDIYALGCTLYYAVTGKVPFPGGTARDKARNHCQTMPLDPRRLNAELSDEFVEVIADMMAKKPEERIQSAGEVITRLAPWANSESLALSHDVRVAAPIPIPSGTRRAVAPQSVSDTEPNFSIQPLDEPGQGDSPSQLSLGTQPMAGASEETLPLFAPELQPLRWNANIRDLPNSVKALIFVGIMTALGTLAAILISLIYAALTAAP